MSVFAHCQVCVLESPKNVRDRGAHVELTLVASCSHSYLAVASRGLLELSACDVGTNNLVISLDFECRLVSGFRSTLN